MVKLKRKTRGVPARESGSLTKSVTHWERGWGGLKEKETPKMCQEKKKKKKKGKKKDLL